jgi:4-hydroxybenzoate polyprenyltransferase
MILIHLLTAVRPHQWIKNLLVLAALVFSEHLLDPVYAAKSLIAMGLFCLMSGSVYLVNDIRDLDNDRQHPEKRNRPIASGRLPIPVAAASAFAFAAVAVWLAFELNTALGWVLVAYGVLNLAYSFHLKHVVILDVMIIAGGFLLRAAAGAFAIGVAVSSWFMLCTLLLALFMGFVKRRQEILLLEDGAGDHRRILDEYTPQFLDQMIAISTAGALVCYALYTMSPEVSQKAGTPYLNLTVPFVIYGLLRYLYLVYTKGQGGNPSLTILRDPSLLINVILWFVTVVVLLYP